MLLDCDLNVESVGFYEGLLSVYGGLLKGVVLANDISFVAVIREFEGFH